MKRKIIEIAQDKCNGCGACANACHEGAIGIVNGKAKLLRDDYCDGLGDCLPTCPTGAISFVEREAAPYDEAAVKANLAQKKKVCAGGCPGAAAQAVESSVSQLQNFPVQLKLAPMSAPYFHGANLLVAADCTAFAYARFHQDFLREKVCLVGCPKLDGVDYSIKLAQIIGNNDIQSVTVVRMEVPCCGGLEFAAKKALQQSGKFIPWQVVTVRIDGSISD